jgi:hypothetical protein
MFAPRAPYKDPQEPPRRGPRDVFVAKAVKATAGSGSSPVLEPGPPPSHGYERDGTPEPEQNRCMDPPVMLRALPILPVPILYCCTR